MPALEFIAAVAWPVTILVIAVMFRRPIAEALAASTGRVKAGPFEWEWERGVQTVEADLGLPSSISHSELEDTAGELDEWSERASVGAIIEASGQVERALRELLPKDNKEINRWGLMQLSRAALEQGRISPETAKAIEGLLVLRNLAAHGRAEEVSPKRVREFVALTQGVLYSIASGA
jgi:hypothetical protein